jgi:hypothetical protein
MAIGTISWFIARIRYFSSPYLLAGCLCDSLRAKEASAQLEGQREASIKGQHKVHLQVKDFAVHRFALLPEAWDRQHPPREPVQLLSGG